MAVAELTSLEQYQSELQKPGTLVVDFYSTQCPPCKVFVILHSSNAESLGTGLTREQVIGPFYDEIANKPSNESVRFYKVHLVCDLVVSIR